MSTSHSASSLALYESIEQDIIEKLQRGEFHAGDRIPSEMALVAQYNVSRITASKALDELALNGYIYRVQGKGSFANPLGSQLRLDGASPRANHAQGPRKVALIIPEHCDYHSGNIIRAVNENLLFPEYYVNLILNNQDGVEEYALSHLQAEGYAGAILFPGDCEFYSDTILKLHLAKFPLVLVDRNFPGISCSCVTSDNGKGVELGMDYLFSLGHAKVAYVSDSSYKEQISSLRYNGYMEYMVRHQLPVDAYESFFHSEQAQELWKDFSAKVHSHAITAVFASNGHVAVKLSQLCRRCGISIPEDLSLLCFDSPVSPCSAESFYTYIDQDSYEMGRQAAALLAEAVQNDAAEWKHLVTAPKLVVNESAVRLAAEGDAS